MTSIESRIEECIVPVQARYLEEVMVKRPRVSGMIDNRSSANRANQLAINRSAVRLCIQVLNSGACAYGDSCKYSHDLAAYLESKPEDLPGRCYIYDINNGSCKFGEMCRFYSSHVLPVPEEADSIQETFNQYHRSMLKNKKSMLEKSIKISKEWKNMAGGNGTDVYLKKDDGSYHELPEDYRPPRITFGDKTYLAPLTTVGNLPFRRVCKQMGVDVTCGEMAYSQKILSGSVAEWALLKRHESEKCFGVQLCGSHVDVLSQAVEVVSKVCNVDFIDLNVGCPIDLVCNKGMGAGLVRKTTRFEDCVRAMCGASSVPITVKMRVGDKTNDRTAIKHFQAMKKAGVSVVGVHGRTRAQRYTKLADWDYVAECYKSASYAGMGFIGNGDIYNFTEYYARKESMPDATLMIGRAALIKPWIFTEIKERRNWDITANERLEVLKEFVNYGLEHWGSDQQGVDKTRRFLLEWCSFLHRYVPVGLLETEAVEKYGGAKINWRPPPFVGRNDLETLMASGNVDDWVKISSLLLGKPQDDFCFIPKHAANSYSNQPRADVKI